MVASASGIPGDSRERPMDTSGLRSVQSRPPSIIARLNATEQALADALRQLHYLAEVLGVDVSDV